ncbi:Zinc finger, CCHC domain-containing protein [Xylographa trunciseda]|nr:Zinc finger, CCHC domain-containing protein [Xylographa trunciseda]
MQKSGTHSASGNAAGADLENRLRGLILNNVLPDALKPAPTIHESNDHGINPELVPPHLRTASIAEQQEYLGRHQTRVNDSKPTASKAQKRLQAQRRRDTAGKLDLVSPTVPNPQVTRTKAQQIPLTSQNQSSIAAPRNVQQAVDTTLIAKPHPQNPLVSIALKQGHHVPDGSHPPQLRDSSSPATSINRLLGSQTPASLPKTYSQGNQRFEVRQNGIVQRNNGQQPFSTSQNRFTAAGNSQVIAKQPTEFARPRMLPNKQLYNPNGEHLDVPSQLNIPVPGPMRTSYLESLAAREIPKAEITPPELQEKEALRIVLNELCRKTILVFETARDASFDSESVALKCFGSLSSGYATHGSDMDLVLISPNSTPDAASPESEIPRLLEKMLLDRGYGARLLTRTRVPIIRFCEKPTPELLGALRDNRIKWEKERDLPPMPKRKKKETEGKNKNQAKESNLVAENAETCSAAPWENLEAPIIVCLPVEIKRVVHSHICDQESPEQMEAETRSACPDETSSAAIVVRLPDADDDHVQTYDAEKSKESQHNVHRSDGEKSSVNHLVENDTNDVNSRLISTRTEKPHPERTDEELVRLYVLAMTEGWFNDEERAIIYRFVNTVKQPKGKEPIELAESRTALKDLPDVLSRYREKPQDLHLDFPKDGVGVQCDINFSNFLALHNTLLLRCYSHCDPRIRPMILFVKAWAKRRRINSPYHGTLSSYGYVLMVLHYVVNVASPPLAPNLQIAWKAAPDEKPEENECKGCNVRFWRSEKEIRIAANRGLLTTNRQPLGSLLRGFFQYFAHEGTEFLRDRQYSGHGFSWSYNVLSLRTYGGILTKQAKGWTGARTETIEPTVAGQESKEVKHRYLFAIEDPFETDHNVARPVAHHGIVAIRDEFRRAHRLILNAGFSNGVAVDLFEEGKDHVQERSFFGPNPARFNRPRRFGPPNVGGDINNTAPAQQDSTKPKVVSPVGANVMTPNLSPQNPADISGRAGQINRIVEQSTTDKKVQDEKDSPDSPISLKEDIRG